MGNFTCPGLQQQYFAPRLCFLSFQLGLCTPGMFVADAQDQKDAVSFGVGVHVVKPI